VTNSLEKELAVIMKITPKVDDVNEILQIFRLLLLPSSVQLQLVITSVS